MTLGQQIKEAREKKNLSQEELAEMIGVSRQAVSKWENDTAVPHGINRETLAQILDIELQSDVVIQKQVPVIAWVGWILSGILLAVLIFIGIKLLPIMLAPTDAENISSEIQSVEIEKSGFQSIRFFNSVPNTVQPDAGWYNTADIENILVSWIGGPAECIQMFVIPTGTETLKKTMLLETKIITDSENAALLSADALHSDKISTMHLYFEITIGDDIIRSETYNVFYENNIN